VSENADHLRRVVVLLAEVRDVIEDRAIGPMPPAWCETRGWSSFLLSLDDQTLEACEQGLVHERLAAHPEAPPSLVELASRAVAVTRVPKLEASLMPVATRGAGARKVAQIAALADAVKGWASKATRIVDLGAGHGHLTRSLAEALDVEALGLERERAFVHAARTLTGDRRVRFEHLEVAAPVSGVGARDLLVGLHACGSLGDALVRTAAASGAGVVLVSCCAQKTRGDRREPVSALGRALGLGFDRAVLGLANLATASEGGLEAHDVMSRRRTRYALHLLLRDAGLEVALGDEMRGLNRRRARRPLEELAPVVLAARGLDAPSALQIARAAERAARDHGRLRRLELPRVMFARVLELALVLDRAVSLDEVGPPSRVLEAFERAHSPRNLAILREPTGRVSP
jgi:hypothetical protein